MSIVTLPVSFVLTFAFTPIVRGLTPMDNAVYLRAGIASAFALFLCCLAWFNLLRDVERGYSPSRCSLAALLLLGATIWPVLGLIFALRCFV